MTDNGWLSAIPLTGLVLLLVLLCEFLVRKQPKARSSGADTPATPTRISGALLCTFVCAVGTVLLVPWAAALPLASTSGLLPGMVFIAFLIIGVLHAFRDGDAIE